MALLSWMTGGSGRANRILVEFPDERFVHAGACGTLSPSQRDENLNAFRESVERRIARLQAFAAALGTTLPSPDGDRNQVEGISRTLDRLCKSQLSGLAGIEAALAMDWRAREPLGRERQLQTLAIDIGTYCGEVGIRCARKYQWVIDDKRYTPSTIMQTSGRVVIGHNPAVIASVMNSPVDAVDIAAFALAETAKYRRSKDLWRPNYFYFLSALADGLHA